MIYDLLDTYLQFIIFHVKLYFSKGKVRLGSGSALVSPWIRILIEVYRSGSTTLPVILNGANQVRIPNHVPNILKFTKNVLYTRVVDRIHSGS
jgi:hypothetical protein